MENVSNLEDEIKKLLLQYKAENILNNKTMKDIRTDLRKTFSDSFIQSNRQVIKNIVIQTFDELKTISPRLMEDDDETKEEDETNEDNPKEVTKQTKEPQTNEEGVNLEYGDVIQILSPSNIDLHNKIFFIHYIDDAQIHIINDTTLDKHMLNIENGSLTDTSIESIYILDKPDEKGFARQNDLLPGKWIQIEFGGDVPTLITGKITDLEEDQIEIQIYPENTKIYIDFGYKGIPQNIPIESIQLRDEPLEVSYTKPVSTSETKDEYEEEYVDSIDKEQEEEDITIPKEDVLQAVQEVIAEADEIVFGNKLEEIQYEVQISEQQKRYSIQEQSEDLLNEILSTIPNIDRTAKVLNRIHIIIERFQQLRKDFSEFNSKGFIEGFKKHGAEHKPLVDKLLHLSKKLYWLLPVVKLKNKIYDEEGAKSDETNVYLDLATIRKEVSQIQYDYYSNTIPSGENKYKYLMKSLTPYFNSYELNETDDSVIKNVETTSNCIGLIDNISMSLQDFYGNVVSNNSLKKRRFVIQTFNLGLKGLEAEQFTGVKMNAKRIQITPNNIVPISSFIMLPEAYVRFSHINLPNTNIYTKANLNKAQIAYWRFLKKQTNITSDVIDTLDIQKEYEGENFLDNIVHISLDETLTDDDKYKKFLQAFIPRTKQLFELVKKYIHNNTSFVKIVEYLEPFMVYTKDISFKQYQTIVDFIVLNVKKLKQHIGSSSKLTTSLYSLKMKIFFSSSILETLFSSNELKQIVFESYISPIHSSVYSNISIGKKMTNKKIFTGELINSLLSIDYGEYYSILFREKFHSLQLGKDLFEETKTIAEELYAKQKNILNETTKTESNTQCNVKTLVKEYTSLKELNDDENTREVYVDKKYDETVYDILEEYKREYDVMEREQFVSFLTRKLIDVNGVPEYQALELAKTILQGRKKVKEGEYAILTIDFSPPQFYIRRGEKWIPDNSINKEFAIFNSSQDPKLNTYLDKYFCNVKEKCLRLDTFDGVVDEKCSSLDVNNKDLVMKQYNQMIEAIVDKDGKHMEETIHDLKTESQILKNRIHNLREMLYNISTQNSRKRYIIGTKLEVIEIERSPYTVLLNRILGITDLKEKMTLIKKFIAELTRPANVIDGEDIYFYYCIITNTKLIPTFYNTLADGFFSNSYRESLELIEKNQGIQSDDGDKIVDKYSGHTIRMIDLDFDEGFDESGFRVVTREVIDDDPNYQSIDLDTTETSKLFSRNDANMILNIIQSTSSYMGISIEDQKEYIVRLVLEYSYSSIGNKEKYETKIKEEAKRGKKVLSYSKKLHQFFIFYSGLIVHIMIQVSIPSKKTRKTFPGCIRSFDGFPLDKDETNIKGLQYISCVMKKISSSQKPWDSIVKLKEEQLVKNMIILYSKVVSKNGELNSKLQEKRDHVKENDNNEDGIPNEYTIDNVWKTFIPYVYSYHISRIESIADDFKQQLMQNLKIGNVLGKKQVELIETKLYSYSLKIQETIQKLIQKEKPLLETNNGEPFIENVCCNTGKTNTTLKYFIDKHSKIQDYLKQLKRLEDIKKTVSIYNKGQILLNTLDLKNKYPDLNNDFTENTIYQTFLKYCGFNSNKPIPLEISSLCGVNKSKISNIHTLNEKIKILKGEGKMYSKDHMIQLLKQINKMNLLGINTQKTLDNSCKYIEQYRGLLNIIQSIETKNFDILREFNSIYKKEILDTIVQDTIQSKQYDTLKDGLKTTINYVISKKEELYSSIEMFMQDYLNVSNNEKKKMLNTLNLLIKSKFKENNENNETNVLQEDIHFVSIQDDTKIEVLQMFMNEVIYIFPNMIQNLNLSLIDSSIKIPKHWNVSKLHENDIKQFLLKSLKPLQSFSENKVVLAFFDHLKILFQQIKPFYSKMYLYSKFIINQLDFKITDDVKNYIHKHVNMLNKHMYEYIFAYSIHYIIEKIETFDVQKAMVMLRETNEDIHNEEQTDEVLREKDIIEGDQFTLKKDIANILYGYLQILGSQFKVINYTKKEIEKLVNRSKEKEKDIKTRTLKELTDEERKVDNELKSAKLGIWNIGLQKGLTQYVKDTYDKEREQMEKEALIDKKLGQINDVTLMNKDIYSLDIIEEEHVDEEIENEAYDIGGLADDDDYGDNDGDEMY